MPGTRWRSRPRDYRGPPRGDNGLGRTTMRIELTQDGGLTAAIPGLQKPPITLNTGDLPEAEAAELARQVETASFFELPAQAGAAPRGAADFRHYTLTVEDRGRKHTVAFDQFTPNEALQALRRQIVELRRPQT